MPHSVLSLKFTPYDYEFQLQDFQYFVVIDFEATCDKGKNPQEIIVRFVNCQDLFSQFFFCFSLSFFL